MAAAEELVLLAQDDKKVSLAVIPTTTTPSTPASEAGAEAAATFRVVVEQCYRCSGGGDEVDTMEDVACRVPVAELHGEAAADRAFEELVAPRFDHPSPRASFDEESEAESDLEYDDEAWIRGKSYEGGEWQDEDEDETPVLSGGGDGDGDDDGPQFSARPLHGALAREGGPSDCTLLLSGFEERADGPELADQHELTSRDLQRLVRLAFSGGDVEEDEGYQRAAGSGTPVSRVTRAVMVDQALRSTRPQPQQPPASARGLFRISRGCV